MQKQILVVGGTGYLGRKVIDRLLKQDVTVRALVRPGTDASELEKKGVMIYRGDITKPETLPAALENADAVVTTAIGYMGGKKGDSLASVDDIGNRNLVDAAAKMKTPRFVFTSILSADKAQSVPHFWQKKLIEDYLRQKGIPFVALRPGAFIDQSTKADFWASGLRKGKLGVLGSTKIKWSYILTDDLAEYMALAAVNSQVPEGIIDVATDEPMNTEQLAQYASEYTGHKVKLSSLPWPIMGTVFGLIGLFKPWMADLK
ncbi:MAG: SDR family oxidoreductase, partial [Bacteroidota bacterium]|nr:SDR family oxidoreductase [Bacteroidota bacterium]